MLAVFLTCCLQVSDLFLPRWGVQSLEGATETDLARLVKGRVLLCLVKKGMTDKQVESVFGRPGCIDIEGSLPECGKEWSYPQYGVYIRFSFANPSRVMALGCSHLE